MQFKVIRDGADWFVADATVGAYSFAIVPEGFGPFVKKADAEKAAAAIQGKVLETRMMETPDRFEEVADTRYGVAW